MKKILFLAFFATIWFSSIGQNQFGDWEILCWDSAGTVRPIAARVTNANTGSGFIRQYYTLTPFAKVVPTVGSITACNKTELVNVADSLHVIIDLLGGNPCQVTDEWRVENLTSNQTYSTNTYNSIAIQAVSGTITVSVDSGTAVTIQNGSVITVRADACRYVQSPVTVGVTSGSAIVSRYY